MTDPADPAGTTTSGPVEASTTEAPGEVSGGHSVGGRRFLRRRSAGGHRGSFWRELPILIVIALLLALLIKTFLVQAFYIPSASMENTLQGGPPAPGERATGSHPYDRVLVNKLVYDFRSPHRGEIVVFKRPPGWPNDNTFTTSNNPVVRFFHDIASTIGIAPSSGSDFIKRVIGVGGDTVSCKSDHLYVDGKALSDESFLYPGSNPCSSEGFDGKTVTVPKGKLFVMGDNRDDSDDSRHNGFVPVSDVVGRAFVVIWPLSDWKTLSVPSTFKQPGLGAAASPYTPIAAGALVIAPVAALRRRRRRRSRSVRR